MCEFTEKQYVLNVIGFRSVNNNCYLIISFNDIFLLRVHIDKNVCNTLYFFAKNVTSQVDITYGFNIQIQVVIKIKLYPYYYYIIYFYLHKSIHVKIFLF